MLLRGALWLSLQEAIVVIKDIFRKYPNRYESIISTLCESLSCIDEPEAKSSLIWIIGEYAERIDNAGDLLEFFLESFADEESPVKLQLVTASAPLRLPWNQRTHRLDHSVLGGSG